MRVGKSAVLPQLYIYTVALGCFLVRGLKQTLNEIGLVLNSSWTGLVSQTWQPWFFTACFFWLSIVAGEGFGQCHQSFIVMSFFLLL